MTTAKKTTGTNAAAKRRPAGKTGATSAAATRAPPKTPDTRAGKGPPTQKTAAQKTAAQKTAAQKTAAQKTAAQKTAAQKTAAKNAAPAKKTAATPSLRRSTPRVPTRSAAPAPATAPAAAAEKVPATGPLTLAQARALAAARRPHAMAARAAAPVTEPPATPGSVAAERERLRKAQDAELARRLREYKGTMEVLKKRGARSPARSPVPAGVAHGPRPAAAPAGFVPLQVIAEGDSWFDYPPFAFKGGLVPRLERRLGVPILNVAKAGDEVRFMLGVKQYQLLTEHLRDGCPAGGAWDVLLFSGGGNDIVDNPMALWLKPWDAAQPPEAHLNLPRFVSALTLVRAGYEDLIALRDRLSPTTELVFHTYDYAIPDGRGVCFNAVGPWLKPAFDLRQFPNQQAASAVVQAMLTAFANELQALAAAHPKVTVVNGQGLLPASTSWWHNELHPSSAGYDRHADNFHATLKALFPTRVA